MRVRKRGTMEKVQSSYDGTVHNWDCTSSATSKSIDFDYYVGEEETMHDVVIPGFHRRSAKGEIFINPMHSFKKKRELSLGAFSYYVAKDEEDCDYSQSYSQAPHTINVLGAPVTHLQVGEPSVAALRRTASTQAKANIDDSTIDGLVFLGELRETIGYLRDPLSSFNKFLSGVRKTKNRKGYVGPTAGFLSDNWLSYRYAMRPLASDIVNGMDAILDTVDGFDPDRRTARGYASSSGSLSDSGLIGGEPSVETTYDTTSTHDVSVRAGILYEYSRSPDTWGMAAHQLPIAAWELIPFSFVADWFVNIGPWIEAITPVAGVRELGSWTTVRRVRETVRTSYRSFGGYTSGGGLTRERHITADNQTVETYSTTSTTRSPGLDVGLTFKVSPLAGDIGKARILDLAALGKQILSS